MHLNLRGFVSHQAELQHRIAQSGFPDLVGITESFLDKSTSTAALIGYTLISRLDRRDGRQGGGIALFARDSIASNIVHIADSPLSERSWHILHTHQGPLLVGLWYRPPCYGEIASITSLEQEWHTHSSNAVGTVLFGDMNVHNKQWLVFSGGTPPEGRELFSVCSRLGLIQKVQHPTRDKNLLDLFLTDIPSGVRCKVLPKISDHNIVLTCMSLQVAQSAPIPREYFNYDAADWVGLNNVLEQKDWSLLFASHSADIATELFVTYV
jgi:hypothetical protein